MANKRSRISKFYLNFQGWKRVLKGSWLSNNTYRWKIGKRYLNVQKRQKVIKPSKGYIKVNGWQVVPKGPRLVKGTKRSKVGRGSNIAKGT